MSIPTQSGKYNPSNDFDFVPVKTGTINGQEGDKVGLEMTFTPTFQTQIAFTYVYASKELPVFAGKKYNDVMHIYVNNEDKALLKIDNQGTSICQEKNDDTCLVAINNLCKTTDVNSCDFKFFKSNPTMRDITFKGYTVPLRLEADGAVNQLNNITVTVEDVGDGKYDSAMFLADATFSITRPTRTPTVPYTYRIGPWTACSATCGIASRSRQVDCVGGTSGVVSTDGRECGRFAAPTTVENCPFVSCESYTYKYGQPGACSATCGQATRQVGVICVQDSTGASVDPNFCGREALEPKTESCDLDDCVTYEFAVSEFGPCGVTCGEGLRTREVACLTDKKQQVDDVYCQGLVRPTTTETCNEDACPYYNLKIGEWGACSVTCGVGTARRVLGCTDEKDNTVSDALCANIVRPSELKSCQFDPCQSYGYTFNQWAPCSVSCGEGVKTRKVFCVNAVGNEVREESCGAMIKPKAEAPCTETACNQYKYKALEWSSCSITCTQGVVTDQGVRDGRVLSRDQGTKTRVVYCVNQFDHIVSDNFCSATSRDPKPDSYKPCEEELPQCAQYNVRWTNYTECSATCGQPGQVTRAREMICADVSGKRVAENLCDQNQLLRERIQTVPCTVSPCARYEFVADRWGECDATCGSGIQSRDVSCQNMQTGEVAEDNLCSGAKVTRQTCTTVRPCATYVYSVDSWCTRDEDPCYNDNVKYTRNVKCLNSLGNEDREENCAAMIKPPTELMCTFDDAKDDGICDCDKCEGGVPVPTEEAPSTPPPTQKISSPTRIGLEKDFSQMTASDKAKVAEDLAAKLGLTGCGTAVVRGDSVTVECDDGKKISGVFKDPDGRRRAAAGTIFEMTAEGVDNVEDKLESVKDLGGTPLASPDTIVGGAMFEFTVEGASQSDVDTALEGVKELGGEKVTDKRVGPTPAPEAAPITSVLSTPPVGTPTTSSADTMTLVVPPAAKPGMSPLVTQATPVPVQASPATSSSAQTPVATRKPTTTKPAPKPVVTATTSEPELSPPLAAPSSSAGCLTGVVPCVLLTAAVLLGLH